MSLRTRGITFYKLPWADDSGKLKTLLEGGKKIIVSTIHKFSFICDEIASSLNGKRFAILIDEAHSSQNGSMSSKMNMALSGEEFEDKIVDLMQGRKLLKNANYYAFTATPKNKTLEMFGEKTPEGQYVPFHEYTMKQAIEEKFILDVLKNYTPYSSYYRVVKKVNDDPKFEKKKAQKKIHAYIESRPETIGEKSRIIVEHFTGKVFMKIGGKARAMVVTSSIERAIEYYNCISALLAERGGKYKAIVAFTDKEIDGRVVTEESLNKFPSSQIETKIEEDPYRILVVADKFQTGYDQPLLHTMYVDKLLSDVKAVQTLSRLNRAHPKKVDTFVLDFANNPEDVQAAFQRYYKTTILGEGSDVNKLNDLIDVIEKPPFYTEGDVGEVVKLRLEGKDEERPRVDAILDANVVRFKDELTEDEQVRAKGAIKNYCRIYPFFAAIMPYESEAWERLYLYYSLLVKKLPKLKREDTTAGLIGMIDFDKYRIVKEEERNIALKDVDTVIDPVPVGGGGGIPEGEEDLLSGIVRDFNKRFGGIEFTDRDAVCRQISELPDKVGQNDDVMNALRQGSRDNAQILLNEAIKNIVAEMEDDKEIEFVKKYFEREEFKNFVNEHVFRVCLKNERAVGTSSVPVPTFGWGAAAESDEAFGVLAAAESDEAFGVLAAAEGDDDGQ